MSRITLTDDHLSGCGDTRTARVATVRGGIYAVDLHQSDAASTTVAKGTENLVPVTTALIATGFLLVADAIVADNAAANVNFGIGVEVNLLVESTTDIAKGDALKAVNAQAYAVKATPATDRYHFIALEARTANDTGIIKAVMVSPFGAF